MRKLVTSGLVVLGLWGMPLGLAAMALPPGVNLDLTRRQVSEISQGEVVVMLLDTPAATMKDVIAVGYVDAPVNEVWRVITDYENYPRLFPNILKSETRLKKGNVEQHYAELDYPWPLPDKWTLNEITHDPPRHFVKWHRIEGTVKEVVGSWRLLPEGKRTLVVYTVRVDPGLAFVPKWAIEWGTTQVAPGIVKNLRKWVRKA